MGFTRLADSLMYNDKEYIVIDYSKGTHPILCADFKLSTPAPYNPSTNNHRGYIANYSIIDGKLYGKKICYWYNERICSEELPVQVTGAFVISRIKHSGNYSFPFGGVEFYTEFPESYELIFNDGQLVEIRILYEAYEEYQKLEKSRRYCTGYLIAHQKKIARKHLKYDYYIIPYTCREYCYEPYTELTFCDDDYE